MTEQEPRLTSIPPEIKGEHVSLDQAMELLYPGGKSVIICGHAVAGEEGYQVIVANILKLSDDNETLVGWAYQHRFDTQEYEHEGFHRVYGKTAGHAMLPNTLMFWISEIDDSAVLEENETRAREIMDWALENGFDLPHPNL